MKDWDCNYRVVVVQCLSRVRFFATPWTVVIQAPLSMGFSRQEHWSELPFPSPVIIGKKVKISIFTWEICPLHTWI